MDANDMAAAGYYRNTLEHDPQDLTAGTNLGTLLARGGDLAAAEKLWQQVFEHNQDSVALGRDLAIAQCMLGQKMEAEETLGTMLLYNPDLREIRGRLSAIQSGRRRCPAE